jgi:hypothetical protein
MRGSILCGIALLAWPIGSGAAATLAEVGDAGDLPASAQAGEGSFGTPLDAITGTIASAIDQDMFEIFINDPASFSASTNNSGTNLSVDDDTMLFLFDKDGIGVVANDDANDATFLSAIPAGSLSGRPAESYFVAVSIFFNTPTSPDGDIFDVEELEGATTGVGPNGSGAALSITGWDLFPDPSQTGSYRIALTGATFAPGDALDTDGDEVPDDGIAPCTTGETQGCRDNCPFEPNNSPGNIQRDTDGNGRGDACECGNADGNSSLDIFDALHIAQGTLTPPLVVLVHPRACDSDGSGSCDIFDALAVAQATLTPPLVAIIQECDAATVPLP